MAAAAMRQRTAGVGCGDLGGRGRRDDVHADVPRGQKFQFIGQSAVDAGIAAVQTHHEATLFGFQQHAPMDFRLVGGRAAAGLADGNAAGADFGEHFGR